MYHNCIFLSFRPFLRKKKKDKAVNLNEGVEDSHEYDIIEERGEFAQDRRNDDLEGSFPSKNLNEALKNDCGMKNKMNGDAKPASNENVEFLPSKNVTLDGPFPEKMLKKMFMEDSETASNKYKCNDNDKEKSLESGPFSPEKSTMLHGPFPTENSKEEFKDDVVGPNTVEFIENDKDKSEENIPFSPEKSIMSHGPFPTEKPKEEFKDEAVTPITIEFIENDKEKSEENVLL